jgi:hypothetical protein
LPDVALHERVDVVQRRREREASLDVAVALDPDDRAAGAAADPERDQPVLVPQLGLVLAEVPEVVADVDLGIPLALAQVRCEGDQPQHVLRVDHHVPVLDHVPRRVAELELPRAHLVLPQDLPDILELVDGLAHDEGDRAGRQPGFARDVEVLDDLLPVPLDPPDERVRVLEPVQAERDPLEAEGLGPFRDLRVELAPVRDHVHPDAVADERLAEQGPVLTQERLAAAQGQSLAARLGEVLGQPQRLGRGQLVVPGLAGA